MQRDLARWWIGLLVVGGCLRAAFADEPTTSDLARAALERVVEERSLSKVLTKVAAQAEGDWNALQMRGDTNVLEPVRVQALGAARLGAATLTTMTPAGGTVRLDLVAFRSGVLARRYVDSLATAAWLRRGAVTVGTGEGGRRAGFRATIPGALVLLQSVGRWGRWVAVARKDLLPPGPGGPAGSASQPLDLESLVESALAAVASKDAAHEEPTTRNPWEDPAAREAAYEDALAAVEDVCRTKFRKRPTFRVPTDAELEAALVRDGQDANPKTTVEELKEEAHRSVRGVLGLYVPESHTLFVVPQNLVAEPVGLEVGWAGEVLMRVIFAHELTHALDAERFGLRERRRAVVEDPYQSLLLFALLEGHAHWVARKAAIAWGIPEAFVLALEMQGRTPDVSTIAHTVHSIEARRAMLAYEAGLAFVQAVDDAKGPDGVDEAFARPPASIEEFDRPDFWLDPAHGKSEGESTEWLTNPIAKAVPGPARLSETHTAKTALRVHLAFLGAEEREGALHGFEGGHGFRGERDSGAIIDATVLRFTAPDDATRFLTVLRKVSEAKDRAFAAGVDHFEGVAYEDGVGTDHGRPGFRVTRTLVAKDERVRLDTTTGAVGRYVLEMNLVDPEADSLSSLQTAFAAYLDDLSKRPSR